MKNLILTLILISTSGFVSSAPKDSIITDFFERGTRWVSLDLVFDYEERIEKKENEDYVATINVYEIIGDTIINDSVHWKVTCKGYPNNRLSTCYETEHPYHYIGVKNGVIWHDSYERTNRKTLYEMGERFEIGDSIRYGHYVYQDTMFVDVIQKIDTIVLGNGYWGIIANDKYIYGLGHQSHPYYWAFENWNPTSNYYHSKGRFLCFFYKGEIILQDDELMELIKKSIGMDADHILPSAFNDRTDTDAPIYDLTGRRLKSAPKKGIYIQGGKKRVVK